MKLNPWHWSKAKQIILGISVIVVIGGGWYWQQQRSSQQETATQTIPISKTTIIDSLTLSGQIQQSNLISVTSKASGVVAKVYIQDGQLVKAGDKLAEITLDSEGQNNQAQAWASYLSSKRSLESAEASKYSQQATMFQQWDDYINLTNETKFEDPNSADRELAEFRITQNEWLAAEANYKSQDTAIASSKASLSQAWYNYSLYQAVVTAPVDGLTVGLNLAQGLTVSGSTNSNGGAVSQTVATIKTTGTPLASFNVTEIDIARIQTGQKVSLTLDSYPEEVLTGVVVAVDRVGSSTNGVTQYPILVRFDSDDEKILPNMAVSAELVFAQKENVFVIPATALSQNLRGENVVRIMKNSQVESVPVEVGIETDTQVEIVSGLNEGDLLIVSDNTTQSLNSNTPNSFSPGGLVPGTGPGMSDGRRE